MFTYGTDQTSASQAPTATVGDVGLTHCSASATVQTAAYYVGTRRRHLFLFLCTVVPLSRIKSWRRHFFRCNLLGHIQHSVEIENETVLAKVCSSRLSFAYSHKSH